MMKAAIAHGLRPSAIVLGRDSRNKWGKWDFLLAKAYQRYLDELCPQCGMPIYICHSTDSRVEFKIVKDICFAAAAVERAQKQASDSRGKSGAEPGARFAPEPRVIDDGDGSDMELSEFRLPYYREVAIRKGLIPTVDSEQN